MSKHPIGSDPLFLRDEELLKGIELLFYAYRDFTKESDEILRRYGYGRAHHRVLHFIGRYPNITVRELLSILKITKQSLGRVLKQLIDDSFVNQSVGIRDRRQRQHALSQLGLELERSLSAPQRSRVAKAYNDAGADAVAGYCKVLLGLIDTADRAFVQEALSGKGFRPRHAS